MKTIIIDDEPLALTLLQEELAKIPFLKIEATFGNPIMAINYLQQHQIDLVFTDISMPDINGLQLIKSISSKPMFILATAHKEYAVEGFELDVIDYLVKPYSFDRLFKAVLKAQELLLLRQKPENETPQFEAIIENSPNHIFVKSDYKDVKIDFNQITYISALKDYIKIFIDTQEKAIITQMNLKAIEEILPSDKFCRVHRSYLVNIKKVNAFNKTELYIGKVEIPIGDLYKNNFLQRSKS
jgi:DNA-binding LytR/AlgR family response regulator